MQAARLVDACANNPLVNRDRRLAGARSPWVRSFACDDMAVLIVCRGPIRKEAVDVFREMGMTRVGILLSERDSIVYPRALSPELRIMDPEHVHPVADYTGASKEERVQRVKEIIAICRRHGYDYVFAGYGFMAEDADFVRALEDAGLRFIGPGSTTQLAAGAKDEAKRTAIANNVSVTPGVNNATARTLLRKYPTREALAAAARRHGLSVPQIHDPEVDIEDVADLVLDAGYARHIDLHTTEDLAQQLQEEAERLLAENPGRRFRLKAIGGGGGKGQRILSRADQVPGFVREILNEVKATGVGDNKNMLLELNVEHTRHNEIQLIGNGDWSIALGGRDCSLQMHEQKLVEVSITQEELQAAISAARAEGNSRKAKILEADLGTLQRMEDEAERFGRAVKLDSASTFECIVEGDRHYFMEVNTRIQVEHRVSELCYTLRFTNPDNVAEHFDVDSLVECMALVARHKERLPRPSRVRRNDAAIEVRLNATDRALNPHAGGVISSWSDPTDGEIRDDQGISLKNPDTGLFMRYRLAGAYDSNIALLLAAGSSRRESFERISEILRRTTIRGLDLATNLDFHRGLVSWFLHRDVWAKPTTRFVVPYLTLVGELAREAQSVDFDYAFQRIEQNAADAAAASGEGAVNATKRVVELKETLLERPITMLIDEPHHLSAWLSRHRLDFEIDGGRVVWRRNPAEILADTYHLLYLDDRTGETAAANRIWDHDKELLDTALSYYGQLSARVGRELPWSELDAALRSPTPEFGFDAEMWERVAAAHAGHQLGLEILGFLPLIADAVGFYDLKLEDELDITIPDRLLDAAHQEAMRKVLVPPPATRADEIVAAMGGTYYSQEAPGLPPFVATGAHFEKGDALYIIEVMKMFNKVYATFSGTINEVLVKDSGVVVRKGQSLFKVTPDEQLVEEDPEAKLKRVRARTDAYLERLL
jgi:acetyl/propionyl-CoA carboxylase alpha subunit